MNMKKKKIPILFLAIMLTFLAALVIPRTGTAMTYAASDSSSQYRGLTQIGSNYYYYSKGKRIKNQWKNVGTNRYYFGKDGKAYKSGHKLVKNAYYIFNANGTLFRPSKNKFVKYGKYTYYINTKGASLTKWHVIKGKLYYFSRKAGKMRTNQTIRGVKLSKSGAAVNNDAAKLKIRTMSIVSSITNSRMSKSQKLAACWRYVVGGRFHYAGKYPNLNSSGWQRSLALNMLNTGSGNCYGFACAFAALAYEVGYSPVMVCGRVPGRRDGSGDGYTRHCWVKINGRNYDPEGQYAGWAGGIYGTSGYPVSCQIQRYVNF